MKNIYDYILRKFGFYDSNGLKYSKKHLLKMQYAIAFEPLSLQANYADLTTVNNIKNNDFILSSCANLFEINKMEYYVKNNIINANVIGNIAFIALNGINKEVRMKCLDLLHEYKTYVKRNNHLC